MLTEPLAQRLLQAHRGWYALTWSFVTRCKMISLLWGAPRMRNYSVMTTSVSTTLHNIAHHRS